MGNRPVGEMEKTKGAAVHSTPFALYESEWMLRSKLTHRQPLEVARRSYDRA